MRTMYLFNMVTVDGYFEGQKKWEIDWHNVDAEFNDFALRQLDATDLLVFGRVTYEGMASYWPTQRAMQNDPVVAAKMNSTAKMVCSKTLKKAEWSNTKLIHNNVEREVGNLKQESGKAIGILGSATLATTLINARLVDEVRVMVNPLILGNGSPLFRDTVRMNLKLLRTTTFQSGNVLLCYAVNQSQSQ
jgi:dihydrofolate reductase